MKKYCVRLGERYPCFLHRTYVHTHKIDLQEKINLHRNNPRGLLRGSDLRLVFRKLQSYISSKTSLEPEIKATIFREWQLHYGTLL
jgi:hypothetical protein